MGSKCKFVFPCLARCSCFFTWCMVTLDWHRFLLQIKYRSNKKLSGKREVDKLGGHVTPRTCSWGKKQPKKRMHVVIHSKKVKRLYQRSNNLKATNKFSRWFYYDCYLLSKWCRYETMYTCIWMMFNKLINKKIMICIKYQKDIYLQ